MVLHALSQEEFEEVIFNYNATPRKILGWKTPLEVFMESTVEAAWLLDFAPFCTVGEIKSKAIWLKAEASLRRRKALNQWDKILKCVRKEGQICHKSYLIYFCADVALRTWMRRMILCGVTCKEFAFHVVYVFDLQFLLKYTQCFRIEPRNCAMDTQARAHSSVRSAAPCPPTISRSR